VSWLNPQRKKQKKRIFFFFDMSTQEGEDEFELVTSAS